MKRSPFSLSEFLLICFLFLTTRASANDVWSKPAFTADPAALKAAASSISADKHSETTLLLNHIEFSFDELGRLIETRHLIYRIENKDGVENWAEVSSEWETWHQDKPQIKARVITSDGAEHWLDPRTLSDLAVRDDEPDVYRDVKNFGGPLPAIAQGAIVEEVTIVRDNAPLFAAGTVRRVKFAWNVPVYKTRVLISHPKSLSLQYQTHLLPDASVSNSDQNGSELILIEQASLPARTEQFEHVPPDAFLFPELEFTTGTSWAAVAAEYAHLSNEKLRSADVQPLLAELNDKSGTRMELIRKIVAFVHKNVRYTGVEFGESSLIPQYPSETLKRKYGDCKDKSALLVAMLRAADIPSSLALLDAGPGRDINSELPGMGMFDHAIVYVPAAGSDPDLWIDATAQYSQVGTLPWMDYGRWALVVSDSPSPLKRIPELTAARNVHREFREFTLAEYGAASITETNTEIGPEEADYRSFYSGDAKKVRENSETYVKDTYLADSLLSFDHGDLADLEKPVFIKFTTKGKRGYTDLNRSVIAIRTANLYDRLPEYFRIKEDNKPVDSAEFDKPIPRTADWWITPFTTEWHYMITAPAGFKLRALPENKDEKIDTLRFLQRYSSNPDGTVVEAIISLENTTTRMTVEQAQKLRDAVIKARNVDPISITFDNIGYSLISAGKIKQGLAAYQQVAVQHPKEALHKVQLAQALLSAGLGEQARVAATEASALEPDSALAFGTLGTVLKHDLIGRVMKKGMDYDGAVIAYRKAIQLDPKDKETRANLAILLEYDSDGIRYSDKASLKSALVELRELKKLDEKYSRTYDDNVLYDLCYNQDFAGVLDYASTLPGSDVTRGLTLVAIAMRENADAALKKSLEITADNQVRNKALITAGLVLARLRRYPQASAMFAEGAHGQPNESQLNRSASMFAKTKPFEQMHLDPADPKSVVLQMFGEMLSGKLTLEEFNKITFRPELSEQLDPKDFSQASASLRVQLLATGLPLVTIADMAVSNMRLTLDGDDSMGYKVIVESPGAANQELYVVRDGAAYKLAAFSIAKSTRTEEIAPLILQELNKNNLSAARKWLDRARDNLHVTSGDDPLAGQPFPYFWAKGQEATPADMCIAALVLLPSKRLTGPLLSSLLQARTSAKTDIDRNRLTMVAAYAYSAQEKWADMVPLAEKLTETLPNSLRAFDLQVTAYAGLRRFDDWDKLVQTRIQQHSDELAYVRSAARLAAYRGQFAKSREISKSIMDKGQSTGDDLNSFAWNALLLPDPISQETLDVAQRANDLAKNSFATQHTLACVYAQAGKTSQARDFLLKAMDTLHLAEPNSEVWFGFGLIAEQYGEVAAAENIYTRVEKPKIDYPATSYAIAQQHLAIMQNESKSPKSSAGQR